jgi:hypothetical protein
VPPIISAARSADSASADGSVSIEIGIGEAAGATAEQRRAAHDVVVAPRHMRGASRSIATRAEPRLCSNVQFQQGNEDQQSVLGDQLRQARLIAL